jgi:hypothetical protein
MAESKKDRHMPDPDSGVQGGGAGRRERVTGSGVYPASAGEAPPDAEIRTMAAWGQGSRGAAGYEDSGPSELSFSEEQLESIRRQEAEEKLRAERRANEEEEPGC